MPLDAANSFAPVGELVPEALCALGAGGHAGPGGHPRIHDPPLDYQRHLFQERQLRSVTANTRAEGEAFLTIAERVGITATTVAYGFEAADQALADLAHGRFVGAAVLTMKDAR